MRKGLRYGNICVGLVFSVIVGRNQNDTISCSLLSLLHSVCHSIHSSEVDMLCFPSSMLVRSFTVNNISGTRHQPLLHAIRNLFVFVEYCHLLELYVKCAALYRTFIPESFWNTRCGRPRGRKFHLTRSLVASEGWSLVRDRTNRKHCPSHEIGRIRGVVAGESGRIRGVLL